MYCKWCSNKLRPTDTVCKVCGRETPAMSDCGGLYNLKYEPSASPVADSGPVQMDPKLVNKVNRLERISEEHQKAAEKRRQQLLIGLGVLLIAVVVLLVLCVGQGGKIRGLQQELAEMEDSLQDEIHGIHIPEHTHGEQNGPYMDENYHWYTVTCNGNNVVISFGAHAYETTVKEPTCTEAGYTTHTCTCGHSYQTDLVDATGHVWQEATCTEPKTCKTCGETDGNALEHDWQDATCTAPKTCKNCEATEGNALEHDWQNATCTVPKTCRNCPATEGEALGHKDSEDEDHNCDTCGTPLCKDENGDGNCDNCKQPVEGEAGSDTEGT